MGGFTNCIHRSLLLTLEEFPCMTIEAITNRMHCMCREKTDKDLPLPPPPQIETNGNR